MSILVVGSVAFDTIETPFGKADEALGGSAAYFSAAASYFAPVRLVGVVGDDFDPACLHFLKEKNVDLNGLEVAKGKTFRWGGKYSFDFNARETVFTDLNVFENFQPQIPEEYRDSEFVFLANIMPELQMDVLNQIRAPKLIALDTMNLWIENTLSALLKTLKMVDILIINDSEVLQLAGEANLVKAAKKIHAMGPKIIIIKKGEHGVMLVTEGTYFWAPAFPLEAIFDPTGAGDTFAGGFMGYLAKCGEVTPETLRHAIIFGSTLASFSVEKFGLDRLKELREDEIRERFHGFWKMTHFDYTKSEF